MCSNSIGNNDSSKRVLCGACGALLDVDADKAPRTPCACGSSARRIQLNIAECLAVGTSMLGMKLRRGGKSKPVLVSMQGERIGRDGRLASIVQIFNHETRRYVKRVELEDGTVVKDVEGPIDDQSLHGPPST